MTSQKEVLVSVLCRRSNRRTANLATGDGGIDMEKPLLNHLIFQPDESNLEHLFSAALAFDLHRPVLH